MVISQTMSKTSFIFIPFAKGRFRQTQLKVGLHSKDNRGIEKGSSKVIHRASCEQQHDQRRKENREKEKKKDICTCGRKESFLVGSSSALFWLLE